MARDKDWRKKELSYEEVVAKNPDLSPLWILKADIQRRGTYYTDAAIAQLNPSKHVVIVNTDPGFHSGRNGEPEGLIMRDGSYLVTNFDFDPNEPQRDPYIVDYEDGRIVIKDQGKILGDAIGYWEKPDYYDQLASNGVPLQKYVSARPQRLNVNLSWYCHFWDTPGEGCKYCPWTPNFLKSGVKEELNNFKYVREAIHEALKQKGRYSAIMLSGGSILSGKELLEDELDGYIALLQEIGQEFKTKRFPAQLISSAFNERQLEKLYENTGLMNYTTDVEVLNEELFNWVCKGKANHIGYQEWKRRLYASVDVFGKGNVSSGVVLGTELAQPNGFKSEEEAYKNVIEEAEEIISHGISLAANIWRTSPGSIFHKQDTPSLDYFVSVYKKFDELHHKYHVGQYTDDYRRCGAHIGLDLLRI